MTAYDNFLVATFKVEERTSELSDLCYDKLGFKNRVAIEGDDSFASKFLRFARIAVDSSCDFFIRSDADCLVFSGITELAEMISRDESIDWVNGRYFDYIMNRFRHGTPHVIRKNVLEHLIKNPGLMKDVQKPESTFCRSIEHQFKLIDVDVFTNLHEYEQYPSKVCNAFLNRMARNHYPSLYDNNYLENLPERYRKAIYHAFNVYSSHHGKNSMSFIDFSFLDDDMQGIDRSSLELLYKKYSELYHNIKENEGL